MVLRSFNYDLQKLYNGVANLTYTALTRVRKQSVSDAEQLSSTRIANLIKSRNYILEEMCVISNWRAACDERGLNQLTRSKYNSNVELPA